MICHCVLIELMWKIDKLLRCEQITIQQHDCLDKIVFRIYGKLDVPVSVDSYHYARVLISQPFCEDWLAVSCCTDTIYISNFMELRYETFICHDQIANVTHKIAARNNVHHAFDANEHWIERAPWLVQIWYNYRNTNDAIKHIRLKRK